MGPNQTAKDDCSRADTRRVLRPAWLIPGTLLLLSAACLPVAHANATGWRTVKLALLLASLPCFVGAGPRPPPVLTLRACRIALVCLLSAIFAFQVLLGAAGNDGSAEYALSEYPDPVSYFVQAKIFASGSLSLPSPEPPQFFNTPYMIHQGRFYSMYPPGWPALLAVGAALRAPWIINPLLFTATLAMVFRIAATRYDETSAWTALLFAGLSPLAAYCASSYFSEIACLFCATLSVWALLNMTPRGSIVHGLIAGVGLGFLSLIRPYTAVSLAIPAAAYTLAVLRTRREVLPAAVACLCATGFWVGIHLIYNHLQTGDALTFPIALQNPYNRLGFGWRSFDAWLPPHHYGLSEAVRNVIARGVFANVVMIPWGFVLIALGLVRRAGAAEWLMAGCLALVVGTHVFYFGSNERHWMPFLFALALLAARGVSVLASCLAVGWRDEAGSARVQFALVVPLLAFSLAEMTWGVAEVMPSRRALADPYRRAADLHLTHAVVFVKSEAREVGGTPLVVDQVPGGFATRGHYVQATPAFDPPVLFVADGGQHNRDLLALLPGRAAYQYEFDRKTGIGRLCPVEAGARQDAPSAASLKGPHDRRCSERIAGNPTTGIAPNYTLKGHRFGPRFDP